METPSQFVLPRVSTGIDGLDVILGGGLPHETFLLLQGDPGAGKTTAAIQFLRAGAERGESCLFIALGNSIKQLGALALSHDWSLDGIEVRELPVEEVFVARQTVFPSQEVELAELTDWIRELIDELEPARVVIDAISYLRSLVEVPSRYRMEIVRLRRLFEKRGITALVIDSSNDEADSTIRMLTDGIIDLTQLHPQYGGQRFHLRVQKMRHIPFHGGFHDFVIRRGGLRIFPRVVPDPERQRTSWSLVPSGLDGLDAMLAGGLETGTACMLLGPSGVGKSTLGNIYASTMLERGGRVAVFLFEERLEMFFHRTAELGLELESHVRSGRLDVRRIDPGTISPGEFGQHIKNAAEDGAEMVVIDSLSGYLTAMAEEAMLVTQLHDLLNYLAQKDVLTIFTVEQHGLVGDALTAPLRVSEVADAVLLLRYVERGGNVCKTVSVLKKRYGAHEKGVRELIIERDRVGLGERDPRFRDILESTLSAPE